MRDPARIKKVLEVVEYYWKKNPDLRLGQLLLNVARDPELYYIEDENLIYKITGMYERGDGDHTETKVLIKKWTGEDIQFADEANGTENNN